MHFGESSFLQAFNDGKHSLSVGFGAKFSLGMSSVLEVDSGYINAGSDSEFNTGQNSYVYVGPDTFDLGPGSKVEMAERSSIEVYGIGSDDSLVLHDYATLNISMDATLLLGISSVLCILPSKTLTIGERSKLSIGDNLYCLVLSDADVPEYTKMEISSSQGVPGGFSCFPQFSDFRQLKARYGIA